MMGLDGGSQRLILYNTFYKQQSYWVFIYVIYFYVIAR